ncbi:MAG TPA: indole-3-glycerol phosphate synthase TrpC [Verrucomicrobiota bacterium]|nr:indole-3-glycerol phosphate synthase TrpC [Verrucomicrobiota bacterium]HRZ35998.1 indole-3-glycerol phosphate synthase TrpC [Candidatus Paceibacterota bacterium]
MDILQTIVQEKHREIGDWPPSSLTSQLLRAAFEQRGRPRDFVGALRHPRRGSVALIAEIKRASPSVGLICPDFDPVRIARAYERAGAACLSVLTDKKFFEGSLESLREVRAAVDLPLLRKDFIVDERQILESIQWGADAILLIVAALDDARLRRFHRLALDAGLAVLVEVHNEAELDRAIEADARLIGVNNRDLRTFAVDLRVTERLAQRLRSAPGLRASAPRNGHADGVGADLASDCAAGRILVAESGIRTRADVARLARCGVQAILVGESLMRHPNLEEKVAELLTD